MRVLFLSSMRCLYREYRHRFPQLLLRMSMIMNNPYATFLVSFDIAFSTPGITFVFEPIFAKYIDLLDNISFQQKLQLVYKFIVYGLLELYYMSIQVLFFRLHYIMLAKQSENNVILLFTVSLIATIMVDNIVLCIVVNLRVLGGKTKDQTKQTENY